MSFADYKQSESATDYSIEQEYKYVGDDYWDWSVWISTSKESMDKIDHVIYTLHYTFPNPVRKVDTRDNNFKLTAAGWGTFTIYARINFRDGTVLNLEHELELYYSDGKLTDN